MPGVAQAPLLISPAGVIERSDGLVETALVIAAVINYRPAAVGAVGELGLRHEIDPPHRDRVEIEMAGNGLDSPLGNIGAFGSSISAIGVDGHGIRHDHLR